MDEPDRFERLREQSPAARRGDLEFGRSLALGFTGVNRPERLLAHLAQSSGEEDLASRLTGLTWALTARRMNDPDYFGRCLGGASPEGRVLLERLPVLCEESLAASRRYTEWQERTREAVRRAYFDARTSLPAGS